MPDQKHHIALFLSYVDPRSQYEWGMRLETIIEEDDISRKDDDRVCVI